MPIHAYFFRPAILTRKVDRTDPFTQSQNYADALLRLTLLVEGFPWDDLRKILHGGQKMAKV